jgi:DNA primase catalytic subunit
MILGPYYEYLKRAAPPVHTLIGRELAVRLLKPDFPFVRKLVIGVRSSIIELAEWAKEEYGAPPVSFFMSIAVYRDSSAIFADRVAPEFIESAEFLIDVDFHEEQDQRRALQLALEEARKIVEVLEEEWGTKPSSVVVTGRGVQIVVTGVPPDPDVRRRLGEHLTGPLPRVRDRRPLIGSEKRRARGVVLKIDSQVVTDLRRLRRMPGSLNEKTATVAAELPTIDTSVEDVIEAITPIREKIKLVRAQPCRTPLGEEVRGPGTYTYHTALYAVLHCGAVPA